MKYALSLVIALSIFLSGCSNPKREAYSTGCQAGIKEAVYQSGREPAEGPIKAFCDQAAEAAYK